MRDKIWCFWEPRSHIHGYLKLCLQTWERLDYEIVILDDSNLARYLSGKELKLLTKNRHYYTLPQYADAVRAMILRRHGGIWMDLDTIILQPERWAEIARLKSETDLVMIDRHIGWIWASKRSRVIKKWYRRLMQKLDFEKYKINRDGLARKIYRKTKIAKYALFGEIHKIQSLIDYINSEQIGWDYLGNSITDNLIANAEEKDYISLTTILPYESFVPESTGLGKRFDAIDKPRNYASWYFDKKDNTKACKDSIFLCLHNSWTPEKYRKMSEEEFLLTDTTLAKVLNNANRRRRATCSKQGGRYE